MIRDKRAKGQRGKAKYENVSAEGSNAKIQNQSRVSRDKILLACHEG
jgi:hypothetical protein